MRIGSPTLSYQALQAHVIVSHFAEGPRAGQAVVTRSQQMAPNSEEVRHDGVNRGKPLQLGSRLEASHVVLSSADRLMRDLGPIVRVLVAAVRDGRHHGPVRGGVTTQLVGDEPAGETALSF
jgi:hypothetical protein